MKQFAIIGLGNFGHYLALNLYKKGHEVLVIDKNASQVQEIKDQVSQAVIADATDRKAMESLGVKDMDAAVVCIGSVLSDSILATLNLKEIGVKRVLAKAMTEAHGRILNKIGASERPGNLSGGTLAQPEHARLFTLCRRLQYHRTGSAKGLHWKSLA